MRTDVKALPLEGQLPLSAQPTKRTDGRPHDRDHAGADRERSTLSVVELSRLAPKARRENCHKETANSRPSRAPRELILLE